MRGVSLTLPSLEIVDLSFLFWVDFRFSDRYLSYLRLLISLSRSVGYFLGILGQNKLKIYFSHPRISLNFSIYSLVKYRLVFTWFSYKMIVFFLYIQPYIIFFFPLISFNECHMYLFLLSFD
jgi:hypothetical protein